MIGSTLGFYFAKLFMRNTLLIFMLIFLLIVAIDLTDQARRMSRFPDVPFSDFLIMSLAKAPAFAERVLPFATLFGSIGTLILLNKKMELVVARAAGVSVWQFLLPATASAIVLGLFSMMVYNPLSIMAREYGKSIEAEVYGKRGNAKSDRTRNFWIRQYSPQGDVIIHAVVARNGGQLLNGVTAYVFEQSGFLKERIDASSARFVEGEGNDTNRWIFQNVSISISGNLPNQRQTYQIDSSLVPQQLSSVATSSADVPFWQLPARIQQAEAADRSSSGFRMQFQSLLARPLFFVAMVLIAATVSLRFARFGQNNKIVLIGILTGFVLYVTTELVVGFGKNEIVSPFVAAWSPVAVATLIGLTILLHQEDG